MATGTAKGRAPAARPRQSRREYWGAQVAAHAKSGLSVAAFCRQQGLRTGTLTFWRWKFAHEARSEMPRPTPAFVPVRVTPAPERAPVTGAVEITLAPGRTVRVYGRVEPVWLAEVLAVVATLRC
jgi:hypothetical protein